MSSQTISVSHHQTSTPSASTSQSTGGVDLTRILPPDVWRSQVTVWMDIRDILSLSSSDKRFRRILRGRHSREMWQSHLAREYPGLPQCPDSIPEHCLVMRIEDTNCTICDVYVGEDMDPFLFGRWCTICTDKEFVDNGHIKNLEVRLAITRSQINSEHYKEYSLAMDVEEGEALYDAWRSTDGEVEKAKWRKWKLEQYSRRKFGRQLANYLNRRKLLKSKTEATLPSPLAASRVRCGPQTTRTLQGGLIRLGRPALPKKSSTNIRHTVDKEGKVPVPAHGVPAGTHVYKSDLKLVQGGQKPIAVSILAPPELLKR